MEHIDAGRYFREAIEHGLKNARNTSTPRYLYHGGGRYWIGHSRTTGSVVLHPHDTLDEAAARYERTHGPASRHHSAYSGGGRTRRR